MTSFQSDLDGVFRALADPTRRAVVARLASGPASVSELAEPFEMALPSFLQHLKVLEDSGLVVSKKSGRVRTCSIAPERFRQAETWLARQRGIWEGRLDRMEALVKDLETGKRRNA